MHFQHNFKLFAHTRGYKKGYKMAYLKKRKRTWYIVFNTYNDQGERDKVARSLGIKNHREAKIALGKINEAELKGILDPRDPELDVKKFINTSYRNFSMMLNEAVPLFLDDHPHWASATYDQYEHILYNWMMKAGEYTLCETRPGAFSCLNARHVENYIYRSGISNETRKKDLRHIKKFCNWLIEMYDIGRHDTRTTRNPCDGIKLGKSYIDYHAKMTTLPELKHLLDTFQKHQAWTKKNSPFTHWGFQAWFPPLMWTYHHTGCRRGEPLLCELQHFFNDFELLRMVDQKGQKIKEVYIKPELKKILKNYVKTLPTQKPNQPIFPNGKTNKPLKGDSVYRVFKFYLKKAELPETRTIHGMRHQSVTQDLRAGIPINHVSKQHGHSSTAVTEIYEHLVFEDLKNNYAKVFKK